MPSNKTSGQRSSLHGLGLGVRETPGKVPYVVAGVYYDIDVICRDDWGNLQNGLDPRVSLQGGE